MNGEHKVGSQHLARKAVVYLRQSSEGQVKHHKESQDLQYALASRARALGFRDVEVIDSDLGSSASAGARPREGFERQLASMALNEVGLVLSRDVSRLSRSDKDFCHLVELCQLFHTLVGDAENVYDVNALDDQLVVGIKGTLSVVELKVLKMRLLEGAENKARRGELYRMLAPGYVFDGTGKPVKDPNQRVHEAQQFVATRGAAHPRKPVCEDAAGEVTLELAHDEPGQTRARLATLLHLGEEGLPVRAHGRVQERALGLAPPVTRRDRRGDRALLCRLRSNCPVRGPGHAATA